MLPLAPIGTLWAAMQFSSKWVTFGCSVFLSQCEAVAVCLLSLSCDCRETH